MTKHKITSGWWYTYTSEKYDFVSWDDDIPNMMGTIKNVLNHQPALSDIYVKKLNSDDLKKTLKGYP